MQKDSKMMLLNNKVNNAEKFSTLKNNLLMLKNNYKESKKVKQYRLLDK